MNRSDRPKSTGNLAVALVLLGILAILLVRSRGDEAGAAGPTPSCDGLTPEQCEAAGLGSGADQGASRTRPASTHIVLDSDEICFDVGYLCAELEESGADTILRWPEDTPRIRVWVPLPPGVSPRTAQALQRAAANGIRVWHEFPFPLEVSTRSVADAPDITVEWSRVLGGNRLGRAQMVWRRVGNEITVEITGLHLATHYPTNPDLEVTPEQLLLVAAHEMGHALGLPHSDDVRDVMYPQNTAWRRTQRDFLTMEAVYRLPNGAIIR